MNAGPNVRHAIRLTTWRSQFNQQRAYRLLCLDSGIYAIVPWYYPAAPEQTLRDDALMIFCSNCGARLIVKVPEGDERLRHVCESCATIHYQNPKIVAGCIPEWQGRLLLCRRAIEPRYGLWTLPAGFMENGETTEQAASRETWEEARARVGLMELYGVFSIPHISQVYLMFRARLEEGKFGPGPESLDVRLFEEHEIPWDELAFPVVKLTLERYCRDLRENRFPVHVEEITRHPARPG